MTPKHIEGVGLAGELHCLHEQEEREEHCLHDRPHLFTTTKAAAGPALCADVNAALQPCKTIPLTGNPSDPSPDGCFAGLKNIQTITATVGVEATCQCVHAALALANPTSLAIVGGGGDISVQVQINC
ncbi:hypothetical protein SO802_020327 [Lithocarpus litseifolius]|uniref:Uncharacterized protein n=1 Tax=Lithocarpus litseifolius TaxID=425828 RepID=A0AAW2CBG1_9ROSI